MQNAAGAQCMSNAEFVPDVGVVDGKLRDNQVSKKQLLEHVGPNVPGADFFVSARHGKADAAECGPDQVAVNGIEVDAVFRPEWHRHKSMELRTGLCHQVPPGEHIAWSATHPRWPVKTEVRLYAVHLSDATRLQGRTS